MKKSGHYLTKKGKDGENFIHQLAYKTFFQYWCYPSPKDEEDRDKKEIADLLICFKDIVILMQIKSYEFKGKHEKYHKNTIEAALSQMQGAERKLFYLPRSIYIKHPDRKKELFDKGLYTKVFRIIVNLGEGESFYDLSKLTNKNNFVHIFNKESFESMMSELDTISDFIDYLIKREELFADKEVTILTGPDEKFTQGVLEEFRNRKKNNMNAVRTLLIIGAEKDLLAHFLKNAREFPEVFKKDSDSLFLEIEGEWDDYYSNKLVELKNQANQKSYFIDELIQTKILKLPHGNDFAKEISSLNRLERRSLAHAIFDSEKQFFEMHNKRQEGGGPLLYRRYMDINNTGYIIFHHDNIPSEVLTHLHYLAVYGTALYTNYKNDKLILISTVPTMRQIAGFLYFPMDKSYIEKIKFDLIQDLKLVGWFTNLEYQRYHEKEYPELD